jgi:tungstate transport system substrate-binding protein
VLRPTLRRVLAGSSLVLVAGLLPGLISPASADDSSTLTVVGTSDVSDSNLVAAVIKPGFEAANPGITLNYVPKGTGAAITYAEAGTASALLVHAASVENQFVGQGFSLEPFGRAIFWGDYVLLGPASDPAGVMTGPSSEDIVQAFQKIATAGADGTANFVSRGGTPGTTIQEHAIWALTSGVTTCTVSDVNGGGAQPSTATGACPGLDQNLPSWYHATTLSQGLNLVNANTCSYAGSGPNNCYVFTDRGTFEYQQSIGAIPNLQVVVDNNKQAPSAQTNLLVNSFHAYGVNPAAVPPGSQINTAGATAFLNWITSPAAQTAISKYLQSGGAEPFRPDAAPQITASTPPKSVKAGTGVTVSGTVSNVVPGTPALDGIAVRLLQTVGSTTSVVAKDITDDNGRYSFSIQPTATGTYSVVTPDITKIERPDLHPVFADQLQSSTLDLGQVTVTAVPTLTSATSAPSHKVEVKGRLAPAVKGTGAHLELWAAHPGKRLTEIASAKLADGARTFDNTFKLGAGTWRVKVVYTHPNVLETGSSARVTVKVS